MGGLRPSEQGQQHIGHQEHTEREAINVEMIKMNGNSQSRGGGVKTKVSFSIQHNNDQKLSNPSSRNGKKIFQRIHFHLFYFDDFP